MNKIIILLLFIYVHSNLKSQSDINIVKDEKIDTLLHRINIYYKNHQDIKGYRIQVFSGVSREEAKKTKAKLLTLLEDQYPVYEIYQQPYFKVKVGDFRRKYDAVFLLNKIKEFFPFSYVVPDNINIPEEYLRK